MTDNVKLYTIYALLDPRMSGIQRVRYVGMSTRVKHRYTQHCNLWNINNKTTHYANWLRSLFNEDLKPELLILEENITDWSNYERKWIRIFRERGVTLTNGNDGGNDTSHARNTPNSHCFRGVKTPIHTYRSLLANRLSIVKKRNPDDIQYWIDKREKFESQVTEVCKYMGKELGIDMFNYCILAKKYGAKGWPSVDLQTIIEKSRKLS